VDSYQERGGGSTRSGQGGGEEEGARRERGKETRMREEEGVGVKKGKGGGVTLSGGGDESGLWGLEARLRQLSDMAEHDRTHLQAEVQVEEALEAMCQMQVP
jgi:hypothetical protein